jgi:1-acyl-sn-glycerol-3-phosphate acyltransferase
VPVGIWGTQARWPRGGLRWSRPWRTTVVLAFGPPILPDGDITSERDIEDMRDRVRDRLEDQIAIARSTTAR